MLWNLVVCVTTSCFLLYNSASELQEMKKITFNLISKSFCMQTLLSFALSGLDRHAALVAESSLIFHHYLGKQITKDLGTYVDSFLGCKGFNVMVPNACFFLLTLFLLEHSPRRKAARGGTAAAPDSAD